ncbi:ATP-dependent Clp protease ATP-binding subunit ClpA [Nocardia transvalensis]|uniref:ATP-dependent Clp protease ATP-binding subunit ClpA n=1 Tax=Nocardia transvalensis TaxID=37333 RepID=A0A7W9PE43_9NOCA|nr:Clp protease N-terminal domain-containing protein [Nocardia transvalensis]MBB5914439.1 ATP-dependent Clp protease ATP-binding subunit ClpA [Nocardia transvalensis]
MFERFSKAARYAVVVAQEEARELRSPHIDIEHLLLGLAACPDAGLRKVLSENGLTAEGIRESLGRGLSEDAAEPIGEPLGEEDAAALRSIGIDLDAVRESLEATFGSDALDRAVPPEDEPKRGRFRRRGGMTFGHIPFTKQAKKALELSLREALSRGDDRIEAAHVLLGVLRAPNDPVRDLAGGDDGVRRLRENVHDLLDRAA